MFYGLAELEDDYFADTVNKFIALAPCIYEEYEDLSAQELVTDWEESEDSG